MEHESTKNPGPMSQHDASILSEHPELKIVLWLVGAGMLVATMLLVGYFFVLPKINGTGGAPKVYHVGILNALDYFSPVVDGFKQRMTELGYVEGKNIIYDVVKADAPFGNQAVIKKFVDDKVDLMVVFPMEASLEAKEVTAGTNIPIVSLAIAVEGTDIVQSVQNPGGNLTGVRFPTPEIATRRLEILHALAPGATRILVPYLKDYPTASVALTAIRPIAKSLGVVLLEEPFASPDEVVAYVAAHEGKADIDAVLLIPEPLSTVPSMSDPIYAFAEVHAIPVAGIRVSDTDSGSAFSVVTDSFEMGRQAAPSADKIFKGTPPGVIPIVTPESVFSINVKVIRRLGLTASESILSTADTIVH